MTNSERVYYGLELGLDEYKNRKIDWMVFYFRLYFNSFRHMKKIFLLKVSLKAYFKHLKIKMSYVAPLLNIDLIFFSRSMGI